MTCNLGGTDFVGTDNCNGRGDGQYVFHVANEIVDALTTGSPLTGASVNQDWFSGIDIERTLAPIQWKKYAPTAGD